MGSIPLSVTNGRIKLSRADSSVTITIKDKDRKFLLELLEMQSKTEQLDDQSKRIKNQLMYKELSGALGHCNSGTTLNIYSHMFQTAQAKVAQAMDGAFSFLPQDTTT